MLAKIRQRYRVWRAASRAGARTPFPWFKIALIGLILFSASFSFQVVFPFIPFMVQDFFPELSREELGQQTGYIAGAYYFGNFIGSLVWGWISDVWGRRPVLILNTFGIALSLVIFGLSQNAPWAIAARFLWGLLDGTLGVCKTCIAEVCDNSNLAAGFATIGIIGSACMLLGSFAGGFLAQPARKYAAFQTPFFCEFPYLLPCSVGVVVSLVATIVSWVYLDETLAKDSAPVSEGTVRSLDLEMGPSSDAIEVKAHFEVGSDENLGSETESNIDTHHVILTKSNGNHDDVSNKSDSEGATDDLCSEDVPFDDHIRSDSEASMTESINSDSNLLQLVSEQRRVPHHHLLKCLNPSKCCIELGHLLKHRTKETIKSLVTVVSCCCACRRRDKSLSLKWLALKAVVSVRSLGSSMKTFVTIMRDKTVCVPILLYGLLGFVAAIVNDLFPLLMVTNYDHGGYKMDDNEISVILMVLASVQVPFMVLIYPSIVKCCGYRWSFGLGSLVFAALCIALPFSNQILGPLPGTNEFTSNDTAVMNFTNATIISGNNNLTLQNTTNSTSSCSNYLDAVDNVNANSVQRIPIYIWIGLLVIVGGNILARQTAFTSVMVMVGNSTRPEILGTVNGYSQALVAVSRTIGPLVGALSFAWTEGNGLDWPLNYHFVFYVCCVFIVLLDLLTFLLPKSIETKRVYVPRTNDLTSS